MLCPTQTSFPEPIRSLAIDMMEIYSLAMTIGVGVMVVVTYGLYMVLSNKLTTNHRYGPEETVEIVWTCLPGVCLLILGFPSILLLYAMDEMVNPLMTVKVIGHQWYWEYEYGDWTEEPVSYESRMINECDLKPGQPRLLTVDKPLILPADVNIRVLVTSGDVIHSWTCVGGAFKVDAVPGRLNQVALELPVGYYWGMCSELCGVNHAFMPIGVEVLPVEAFKTWAIDYLLRLPKPEPIPDNPIIEAMPSITVTVKKPEYGATLEEVSIFT